MRTLSHSGLGSRERTRGAQPAPPDAPPIWTRPVMSGRYITETQEWREPPPAVSFGPRAGASVRNCGDEVVQEPPGPRRRVIDAAPVPGGLVGRRTRLVS